jgi:hypothetical protein
MRSRAATRLSLPLAAWTAQNAPECADSCPRARPGGTVIASKTMSDNDFTTLLKAAFDAARQTGKRDWRRMTVAVLKNRLLLLTERRFSEAAFGATSVSELVARHPELVRLDRTTKPPSVEWLADPEAESEPVDVDQSRRRIRADLWRAVLDYSSGREYEWDPTSGQARPVDHAEAARKVPTLDREDLASWRADFAAKHRADLKNESEVHKLEEWAKAGLGTQHLPRDLQGTWNAFLKASVVERLTAWFEGSSLVAPSVLVAVEPKPGHSQPSELRSLVHRCVDALTAEELRALPLPAHVLLRVTGRD